MRKNFSISVAALFTCVGLACGQTTANHNTGNTGKQPGSSNSATLVAPPETTGKPQTNTSPTTVTTNTNTTTKAPKSTGVKTTNAGDPFPAYTTANRPAKQHADLTNTFVGEWATTTTSWTGEGTQPTTSTGTARFFPAMNGRFVCGDLEGTLYGKPFKGMGFWGFNTNQNRYESTWVDTENTGISTFTGTKTDSNTFTWNGTLTNPVTGKTEATKCVTAFNGKDSFTYTLYTTNTGGNETKAFETTYNRVSQGGPFAIRPVDTKLTSTTNKNATRTTSVTEQQGQTEK
ncbi:MAG: DUF1579 family protein [Planctomycetota bacterium]|nr:DUF1579 family protein [Planctomycetota bacterium]